MKHTRTEVKISTAPKRFSKKDFEGDWPKPSEFFVPAPSSPAATALQKQVGGDHYKGDVIQHVEFCQRNKLTWCESASIKYIIRHRKKNGRQDILKAIHYLELLLEIEYPEAK